MIWCFYRFSFLFFLHFSTLRLFFYGWWWFVCSENPVNKFNKMVCVHIMCKWTLYSITAKHHLNSNQKKERKANSHQNIVVLFLWKDNVHPFKANQEMLSNLHTSGRTMRSAHCQPSRLLLQTLIIYLGFGKFCK